MWHNNDEDEITLADCDDEEETEHGRHCDCDYCDPPGWTH